jgi:hypothetical protein
MSFVHFSRTYFSQNITDLILYSWRILRAMIVVDLDNKFNTLLQAYPESHYGVVDLDNKFQALLAAHPESHDGVVDLDGRAQFDPQHLGQVTL